jgi:PEP-CTERM motif
MSPSAGWAKAHLEISQSKSTSSRATGVFLGTLATDETSAVPEPATALLIGSALVAVARYLRMANKNQRRPHFEEVLYNKK